MFNTFLQNSTQQTLSNYKEDVKRINVLEKQLQGKTEAQLQEIAADLKKKAQSGVPKESIRSEAFALVREATYRVLKMRHFDVQLVGGLILDQGKIAEMKTGEGKTLVALLPAFLNALYGKGVHIITVNDYLAKRDSKIVGQVHRFLGLTTGVIQENMSAVERKQNYDCDIVYVTNNELGFDYLRDNMAFTKDEIVQRPLYYCIVDEVDSILIDEARTPLIISGPSQVPTEKYLQTKKLASTLKKNIHYQVDEKNQTITLSEDGQRFCEEALLITNLYSLENPWILYILNSIKAKELFKLNTHYIVNEEGEIVIIDEFTGRTMVGRRWSDGLHQAIEAKENLEIQDESQTLASITYQNLFLLYESLSGMTGTAKTEELEFNRIYNLDVVSVPTNKELKRKDFPDLIYKNQYVKWQAIANECVEMNQLKRPILVGTTTIEKSELLAALLKEYNISYRLLNARPENIESESEIVAQAGCLNAVTIATNMAGRGTDIILGGNASFLTKFEFRSFFEQWKTKTVGTDEYNLKVNNSIKQFFKEEDLNFLVKDYTFFLDNIQERDFVTDEPLQSLYTAYNHRLKENKENLEQQRYEILKLGGLHIIGTERHESRRIDNQLRGRAARQGDPGSSKFFLSLEDKLLRLFGGDQILGIMQNIGFDDTTPIQSQILNQSLESAQKKVEAYYYEMRKNLFDYDQVLNMQRNGVYAERKRILQRDNLRDWIMEYGERSLYDLVSYSTKQSENANTNNIVVNQKLQELLGVPFTLELGIEPRNLDVFKYYTQQQFQISYDLKEVEMETIESGLLRELERSFLLQQIDYSWKEHLQKISSLREAINWRGYGQKDPLTEYKKEAYNLFVTMMTRIRHRVIYFILRSKILLEN
jgi:preprotein translocase subunit SecA